MEEEKDYGDVKILRKQIEEKKDGILKTYRDLLFAKEEYETLLKLYDELLEKTKDEIDKIVDEVVKNA